MKDNVPISDNYSVDEMMEILKNTITGQIEKMPEGDQSKWLHRFASELLLEIARGRYQELLSTEPFISRSGSIKIECTQGVSELDKKARLEDLELAVKYLEGQLDA